MDDFNNVATCCSFLAKYYLKKGDLDTATPFAQRCLEYDIVCSFSIDYAYIFQNVNDICSSLLL